MQYFVFLLAFGSLSLVNLTPCFAEIRNNTSLQVIAFVPMLRRKGATLPSYAWQKGWETIRGARAAVDAINTERTILPQNTLELVPVDSMLCDGVGSLAALLELH